jgi:eukaryotic-like serine/threonine-protein kinase
MKQCPKCARSFDNQQATFCPSDGTPLVVLATDADPLVGVTIDGKYRIEQLIGAGGMGSVYKARHLLLDRFVAVKMMKSDMLRDPNTAERFKREAQASARLTHPNAVTVYDFGISADGSAYLVMELLKGTSLRDMLKRDRVLSYERAVEVFGKVCSAIDSAHEQGIIHRDLKPDNVMVDERPDGTVDVKVVDFGIAKFKGPTPDTAHLTGTGMIIGTVHYMSPEQCRGQAIDARSDIYSIGIMLYEALVGRTPFESHTPSAVIIDHVNTPPPPPSILRGDLPAAVERVILDALAKRPEDRPRSAGELARRLAGAIPAGGMAATVALPFQTAPVSPFPYSTGGGAQPTSPSSAPHAAFPADSGHRPIPPTESGAHAAARGKRGGMSTAAIVFVVLVVLVGGGAIIVAAGLFGLATLTGSDGSQARESDPPPSKNAAAPAKPEKPPADDSNGNTSSEEPSEDDAVLTPDPSDEDAAPTDDAGDSAPGTERELDEAETTEVGTATALWLYSIMSKDLDATMEHFGDTVDYFTAGEVPQSRVRSSYEKAFAKYDSLEFEVEQVHEATMNADGTMQLVFDKRWDFTGNKGNSSGKVKELLVFKRIDGALKIIKIQDLHSY